MPLFHSGFTANRHGVQPHAGCDTSARPRVSGCRFLSLGMPKNGTRRTPCGYAQYPAFLKAAIDRAVTASSSSKSAGSDAEKLKQVLPCIRALSAGDIAGETASSPITWKLT